MSFRRSIIIAELWPSEVARSWKKIIFLETRLLTGKYLKNSVPKGFISSPIDVLCSNFVKFGQRKIGQVVRYLPDKISPGSPALATAQIAPKICQSQPQTMYSECSRFHPNRFTFGGVIPERVNAIKTGGKVFPNTGNTLPPVGAALPPSLEPNNSDPTFINNGRMEWLGSLKVFSNSTVWWSTDKFYSSFVVTMSLSCTAS